MAIDYSTLVAAKTTEGSIKSWVNRGDIPVTNILLEAEAFIFQRLRTREMLSETALTVLEDSNSVALPSDFLDPIEFKPYEWSYGLTYVNEADVQRSRDSSGNLFSGEPNSWTVLNDTLYTDVEASSDFSGMLLYYAQPEALSGTNETNFLTTRYPTMLRRACMKYAYEFMKDSERMQTEEILTLAAIEEANLTNELYRRTQEHPSARYY